MNNNEAREVIKKAGITSNNVTLRQLSKLWEIVNRNMVNSGNYNNCYGMNKMQYKDRKFMTCHSDHWDKREAISFNSDGFIGFAGWASSENVKPILDSIKEWIEIVTSKDF